MVIDKEIWNYPSEHAGCIYYRQDIGLEVCIRNSSLYGKGLSVEAWDV